MAAQIVALIVFIALFAIGAIRGVHIGVLMIPGAAGVALFLTELAMEDVIAGFPLSIMVLLVGVTYFFAIAQTNGTVDRIIDSALQRIGSKAALIPVGFFLITAGIAAMGAPLAGLVMMPVGMQVARRYGIDYALMGLAICFGVGAGGFAPTSLYGIVTYGTAHDAGIPLNPLLLFGITVATYLLLLIAAYAMFGRQFFSRARTSGGTAIATPDLARTAEAPGSHPFERETALRRGSASASGVAFGEDDEDEAMFDASHSGHAGEDEQSAGLPPFTPIQILTVVCIVALLAAVVLIAAFGREPDIGLLCFAFASVLALVDPATGRNAVSKIDWSTVLLVGGIITFVGVLQHMGAVDLLGQGAKSIGAPIVAAFVLCAVGGLVSAFASTTGILAALVPLALPLVADGSLPGWALITALGICSAVVDVSPYSTLGATVVATAPLREKERLTGILVRFGLSMVVIGPLLLVGGLVVPAMLL
ncbi:SLC13 family permease [Brevibacterium daeguense]|uniref:SLC13 family permease n=1 Tax=Brevibacterium daeguense TaxID=909936 RepID=A0ABP8EGH3_9MICO|nr:SLC13 family permease [Brevibacterium daeguense]